MKKIGEIMEELGFRKDAPEATKEAFIKYLIKASGGPEVEAPSDKKPEQLLLFEPEAS